LALYCATANCPLDSPTTTNLPLGQDRQAVAHVLRAKVGDRLAAGAERAVSSAPLRSWRVFEVLEARLDRGVELQRRQRLLGELAPD
jgi:hypothetical protein